MKEVLTLTVGADEGGVRLDRWFRRRWPHLTQGQLQKLIRSGQVRVDGARAKADTRLEGGEQVRVPPLPEAGTAPERRALDPRDAAFVKSLVLYEDDEVLALNKPAGLAVDQDPPPPRRPAERLGRRTGSAEAGAPPGPRHLGRAGSGQVAPGRRPPGRRLRQAPGCLRSAGTISSRSPMPLLTSGRSRIPSPGLGNPVTRAQ
jgi:23S rRNA pseudouridine955/2504/2580 synthase